MGCGQHVNSFSPQVGAFLGFYLLVMLVLCVYGVHRYYLVHLYYKYRRNRPELTACFRELPRVTVQLPMYNERFVARRVIESACRIEYPRDRLQIQVLDDSTDETVAIARETVERMRAAGHDVVYLHRDNREGYKAGALAEGLKTATGEFVMIFDADFIPPPDILLRTIHYFTDPKVGMVQARWDHINRDHSLLTRTQAILLDGHFVIEHTARNRSGRFMSFNGTGGMWRRACIDDAGGWQHDTLTEDLDLSYRAQMKGWRFIFLPDLVSPAELPPEMNAFKSQQYRWAKGGAQTCKKLLPKVLASRLPLKIKVEAFFHLTSCCVYILIVLLTLMLYPVVYLKLHFFPEGLARYVFDASLLLLATCSASTFYAASQREVHRTWAESLKYLPFLMSLGIGISLNNAKAALAGFFGNDDLASGVRARRPPTARAHDGAGPARWSRAKARASARSPLRVCGSSRRVDTSTTTLPANPPAASASRTSAHGWLPRPGTRCSSRIRPCRKTLVNGTCGPRAPPSVMASSLETKVPNMTIRATQKNKMSYPVTRTVVG